MGSTTNYSIQLVDAGGLEGQAYSWLLGEFEASLDYMRDCLKNPKKERKEKKEIENRPEIGRTGEGGHWELSLKTKKFQTDRLSEF